MSSYNFVLNNPLIYTDKQGDSVELIIGKPYTLNGEEHKYGHVALRVFNSELGYDKVFDFGRYAQTWGFMDRSGEGILNVYKDGDIYIKNEQSFRTSIGYTKATTPAQDQEIIGYFDDLVKEGTLRIDNKNYSRYRLKQDYDAFGPNCCTLSGDGLEQIGFNWIGDEYDPREALLTMEKKYQARGLIKTIYYKGGKTETTMPPLILPVVEGIQDLPTPNYYPPADATSRAPLPLKVNEDEKENGGHN